MKRRVLLFLAIALIIVFLMGCEVSDPENNDQEKGSCVLTTDVIESDKTEYRVIASELATIANKTNKRQVMLIADLSTNNPLTANIYLSVALENGNITRYEFGECDNIAVFEGIKDKLILLDVDKDGTDEIIVNFYTTGNRASLAEVLRIKESSIEPMFNLNYEDEVLEQSGKFNPIFHCEFIKGYKVRIFNDAINFSCEVDISHYSDDFFDESGVGKSDTNWVYCKSVYSCEVKNETPIEIVCECPIKLDSAIIGTMRLTYKYDSKGDTFVLNAAELKTEDGHGDSDNTLISDTINIENADEIIEESDYYKLVRNGTLLYCYFYDDNHTEVKKEGPLAKMPRITTVQNGLVKFTVQAGTGIGTRWGYYYDTEKIFFPKNLGVYLMNAKTKSLVLD